MNTYKLSDPSLEEELCGHFLYWSGRDDFAACRALVQPEDFTLKKCAFAWRVFGMVHDRGLEVNAPNVNTVARSDGLDPMPILLIDGKEPLADVRRMAVELHELATRRRYRDKLAEVITRLEQPDYSSEDAANDVATIVAAEKPQSQNIVRWGKLSDEVLRHAERLMNGETLPTVECGLKYIDTAGGLRLGDLNIIAGRTSNGKSSLAMTMAVGAALRGNPVGVFTLEMSAMDISFRIASMFSDIPASDLMVRPLGNEDFSRLYAAVQPQLIADMPLYFAKPKRADVEHIVQMIRQMREELGVKLVVIDYVQLLSGAGRDQRFVVGNAANQLKALAVELDINILLLSQLARQAKGATAAPKIYELKESGDLENAADNVFLIYRPELYHGEAFPDMSCAWSQIDTRGNALIVHAKARSGPIGEFMLGYDGSTSRFFDRDSYDIAPATAETTPF